METVGVRELRQRASELLRQVEGGDTIQITDRGRPVALLSPLPEAGPLQQLRSSGDIRPADVLLRDLPEPLQLKPGQEPPSVVLQRLRRDER